jgi:hypothetical protein
MAPPSSPKYRKLCSSRATLGPIADVLLPAKTVRTRPVCGAGLVDRVEDEKRVHGPLAGRVRDLRPFAARGRRVTVEPTEPR